MQSSDEERDAFAARTEAWIAGYLAAAAAVLFAVAVTRNVAFFVILAGVLLLGEHIRRAREGDLREREAAEPLPHKVRLAAKAKRE